MESPADAMRKLTKLPPNKRCADCNTKLPQCVNLTVGSFICLTCSGIHREINSKIKSLGHSTFTDQEVEMMKQIGNDKVNAMWLARYDPENERNRMNRQPDGNQNQNHLRTWIRRKYNDKHWYSSDGSAGSGGSGGVSTPTPPSSSSRGGSGGGRNNQPQPTVVQIPTANNPPVDLFASPSPVATNTANSNDGSWAAFGGSTQPQQQQQKQQLNSDPFAQPPQQQQSNSDPFAQPPQQQQNQNFANFGGGQTQQPPQQQQPSQGGFANFDQQQAQVPPQQQQQQQQPVVAQQGGGFTANFNQQQTQAPPPQQQQHQQQPVVAQQGGGFTANFNQQQPPIPPQQQQQPVVAQQGGGFTANFNQQQPPVPPQQQPVVAQQGGGFTANFDQQQTQAPPPQQQQQQQQQHLPVVAQQGVGFTANFNNQQNQQQQMMRPPQQLQPPQNQQDKNFRNFNQQNPGASSGQMIPPQQQQQQQPQGGQDPFGNMPPPSQGAMGLQPQQPTMTTNGQQPQQQSQDGGNMGGQPQQSQAQLQTPSIMPVEKQDPMDAFAHLSVGNNGINNNNVARGMGGSALPASNQPGTGAVPTKSTVVDSVVLEYKEMEMVCYKSNGTRQKAQIVKRHLDDELQPFYTIGLLGREKQTDVHHLEPLDPSYEKIESTLISLSATQLKQVEAFLGSLVNDTNSSSNTPIVSNAVEQKPVVQVAPIAETPMTNGQIPPTIVSQSVMSHVSNLTQQQHGPGMGGMMGPPAMTMTNGVSSSAVSPLTSPLTVPKVPAPNMGGAKNMMGQIGQSNNAAQMMMMQQPNISQQPQMQGQMVGQNPVPQMMQQPQMQGQMVGQQNSAPQMMQQPQVQGQTVGQNGQNSAPQMMQQQQPQQQVPQMGQFQQQPMQGQMAGQPQMMMMQQQQPQAPMGQVQQQQQPQLQGQMGQNPPPSPQGNPFDVY